MARHERTHEEVELNLAAMLDMAFQLLAFFILTFRPSPTESMLAMRLPPPRPTGIACPGPSPGEKTTITPVKIENISTLAITVYAGRDGMIGTLGVNDHPVADIADLGRILTDKFENPARPFDQVVVQASSKLRYGELMRVVEVCTHQTLGDKPLNKLSFLEIPEPNN